MKTIKCLTNIKSLTLQQQKHQQLTVSIYSTVLIIWGLILILDRVLYARKGGEEGALSTTNLGGDKITVEEACVS